MKKIYNLFFRKHSPNQTDSLNIMASSTQIISVASFCIFTYILSCPGDFDSFIPFSVVSTEWFVTDLKLSLIDLSMSGRNWVGSTLDFASILPAKKWPTLTKCLLKGDTISSLSIICLLSRSITGHWCALM